MTWNLITLANGRRERQHVFFMLILTTWAFNDILWRLVFHVYVKRKIMMLMLLVRGLFVVLNTRKLGHIWIRCKNYWVLVTTVKLVYFRKESRSPQFQRETITMFWKNNDSPHYLQKKQTVTCILASEHWGMNFY